MTKREKKQKKIIAMAGGGTGGHVFPIRSLLETLFKTPAYASQVEKIYRFGSAGSLEEEIATQLHPLLGCVPYQLREGSPQAGGLHTTQLHFLPIFS
jgi:hypothetical protein